MVKGFTRPETIIVGIILCVIGLATILNLQKSRMLARDVQRKNDIKQIASAIGEYSERIGVYPTEKDLKIATCGGSLDLPCRWGEDPVAASGSALINPLPRDPFWPKDYFYIYKSDVDRFQLYAHLENRKDDEFNAKIEQLGLMCGPEVCNFGVASERTSITLPLDEQKTK